MFGLSSWITATGQGKGHSFSGPNLALRLVSATCFASFVACMLCMLYDARYDRSSTFWGVKCFLNVGTPQPSLTYFDNIVGLSVICVRDVNVNKILKFLAWRPIQGLTHVCPRHWQEPQLACVRHALASLHARRAAAKTGLKALVYFCFLRSPGTPIPDRQASFSISNAINIALSVTLFSCVQTNLPFISLGRTSLFVE